MRLYLNDYKKRSWIKKIKRKLRLYVENTKDLAFKDKPNIWFAKK